MSRDSGPMSGNPSRVGAAPLMARSKASLRRASGRLGVLALFGLASATGCGVNFDEASELDGLRVITVKKSTPYARPGDTVDLRMLYHDDVDEPRDVQILWLRGCRNPPADLVGICYELFSEALKQAEDVPPPPRGEPSTEDLADLTAALQETFDPERLLEASGLAPGMGGAPIGSFGLGFGDTFQLTLDADIISSRPPPFDSRIPAYGIEYVFTAACAGQLWLDPDTDGFPIGCYDERGRRVGADRFVMGYTKLWAYEELSNRNPRIVGLEVRGERLADDEFCIDDACATLSPEDDDAVTCPSSRRLAPCADEDQPGKCPTLPFQVLVDPDSVDDDGVLSALEGAPVREQMWVSYYADSGAFSFDVALVNDSLSGFNEDPASEFSSPEEPGIAHVWAVVHDNRGGTSWARFEVCIEE